MTAFESVTKPTEQIGRRNPQRPANAKNVNKADIAFASLDAAAEWLYEHERWNPWTHYCWVSNLRFGQAVRAHRYMCARYNKGFSVGFDAIGLVTVIEPPDNPNDYARVQFYPKGTRVEVKA